MYFDSTSKTTDCLTNKTKVKVNRTDNKRSELNIKSLSNIKPRRTTIMRAQSVVAI